MVTYIRFFPEQNGYGAYIIAQNSRRRGFLTYRGSTYYVLTRIWAYIKALGMVCPVMVLFALLSASPLYADPQVNQVVQGEVSVAKNGNETVIHAGNNSIIEYDRFDILSDEAVRFIQPDSTSRVLNRVLSDNPSLIAGRLDANGIVYLTNQAGIIFGEGALVNTGAFYAAAGRLSDDDFLNSIDHFTDIKGDIVNEGHINADAIYMLGKTVSNFGTLQAEAGTIAMVTGDDILIGHPLDDVSVKIKNKTPPETSASAPGIEQVGTVNAPRGTVMFGAGDMASVAIHHTGITTAQNVSIDAGNQGTVSVSGSINVSNQTEYQRGGSVAITGHGVNVENAAINADGQTGGGTIEIGGSLRGDGDLDNAQYTYIDTASTIMANAVQNGNGGHVIIWGDRKTEFRGSLTAKGGAITGDGGFAEISGNQLIAKGRVDLGAANGAAGTLLYDPINIEIIGGSADGDDSPDGSNSNLQGDGGTNGSINFADTGTGADPFRIYESEIEGTNANIILEAEENITVSGNFGGDDLLIMPNNDLTLRIRNDAASGIIDLTTASEGKTLLVRTQGSGSILLEGSTDGAFRGDIRTGFLQSDTGDITLHTNNGTVYLANDIQTDGGDVVITGDTVLENSVIIDTELGGNSAAGNVDFSGAVISRVNISNVGEAGTFLSPSDGGWFTLNFTRAYVTPIIVATTNTHNGQAALVPEVRNVTANAAEIRLCESEGSSGAGCDTHAPETVGYFIFDAAESAATAGIEAGSFSIGGTSDSTTTTINFTEAFTSAPIVLALVTSDNGGNRPVEARVVSTNINSFTAGICFQNSLDGCDGAAPAETVHWIAIDPNNLPFAQENEAGRTGDIVSNSTWTLQNFTTPFSSVPVVIAETQTDDGTEDNEIDEVRNVTTTSVEVRYCEMQSGDSCDSHTSENVAWYAVAPGLLGTAGGDLRIDTTGTTNGRVDLGTFNNDGGGYLLGLNLFTGDAATTLHGNISLDSPGGATFNINGTGDIIMSDHVTIDMEVGGDDTANAIDFTNHTLGADAGGYTLTLDTRGADNGNVTLGHINNAGGAYLQGLVINNGDARLTLNNDITLNNGGGATRFIVNGTGDLMLNSNVTIDMEEGDNAAAGLLDISQLDVTTFATFESGEAGSFTAPINGGWYTLNFARSYTTPVVVGTSNTENGNAARVIEVRNVTATSAEIRVCESDGHIAAGCAVHPGESVGYLVFDAADSAAIPGIEAGLFSQGGNFDSSNTTVNFAEAFTTVPLVFANVQTVTGASFPVETRVTSVSVNSFTGGICFQTSTDGCSNGKGAESIGWVAIDPNNIPFPVTAEGGTVSIGNSTWTTVNFTETFSATPIVLVETQTENGGQDVEIDEARNIGLTSADIRYCELDGPNSCDTHNAENVVWFAIEPFAAFFAPDFEIDGNGTSGADIRLGAFNNSGGKLLNNLTAYTNTGAITLAQSINVDGNITLNAGSNFYNDAGPAALQASGNYLVYSAHPTYNNEGGITPDFTEFNKTYPEAPEVVNLLMNGFIYSLPAVLPVTDTNNAGLEQSLPNNNPLFEDDSAFKPGDCAPGSEWIDTALCDISPDAVILTKEKNK